MWWEKNIFCILKFILNFKRDRICFCIDLKNRIYLDSLGCYHGNINHWWTFFEASLFVNSKKFLLHGNHMKYVEIPTMKMNRCDLWPSNRGHFVQYLIESEAKTRKKWRIPCVLSMNNHQTNLSFYQSF